MKKKFILPAALALTLHAYLLFGLSDRPVQNSVALEPPKAKDKPNVVEVDTAEAADDPEDPAPGPRSGGPEKSMPRITDCIFVPAPPGAPTVAPLPPVPYGPSGDVIDPNWQLPGPRGGGAGKVYTPVDLDRVPRARSQPSPFYPADLRNNGVEGTVVVEFQVDLDGNVCSAEVIRATHAGFIDAAVRAVERWKFEPGRRAGKKVRFRMSVPLVFHIDNN
jgi:protein TonB